MMHDLGDDGVAERERLSREEARAAIGTVASGWGQVVPCLYGPGKFCLVHWRFCAVKHSPHARGRAEIRDRTHFEATYWACLRIRSHWRRGR